MNALYVIVIALVLLPLARRAHTRWAWRKQAGRVPRHLPFKTYVLFRGDYCWHRVAKMFEYGAQTYCNTWIDRSRMSAIRSVSKGSWEQLHYEGRVEGQVFPCPACITVERTACSVPE